MRSFPSELLVVALVAAATTLGCRDETASPADTAPPLHAVIDVPTGEALARRHCIACHRLPAPEQLPRTHWPFVVDWMGNYLGHPNFEGELGELKSLVNPALVPAAPLVTADELARIRDHYVTGAPTREAMRIRRAGPQAQLTQFAPRFPRTAVPPGELVTLLKVDAEHDRIFVGTAVKWELQVYDRSWRLQNRSPIPTSAIHVEPGDEGFRLTLMGDFTKDREKGAVVDVSFVDEGTARVRPVIEGLHRMTQHHTNDLDGDGIDDVLTVGFGDLRGRVSLFWGAADGSFEEQVLIDRSGGLCAVVEDLDGDGDHDVAVLMAQGRNELIAFRNDGPRKLSPVQLLEQVSSFGYNDMSTADFDGDGLPDLITANGNNLEMYDPPLRPYHGVRILQNRGELRFEEIYFFPLHGAMQVLGRDFDQDGDVDIAAIAFAPDWDAKPPETFVYLSNDGDGSFSPSYVDNSHFNRWIRMDAGDLDQDGDLDILLGAGALDIGWPPERAPYWRQRLSTVPSLLVLENLVSSP